MWRSPFDQVDRRRAVASVGRGDAHFERAERHLALISVRKADARRRSSQIHHYRERLVSELSRESDDIVVSEFAQRPPPQGFMTVHESEQGGKLSLCALT